MSSPQHAWMPLSAFTDRRLGARDLRILGTLYAHAGVDRTCWPSVATLSKLTGIDRRDTQRTLRRLEGLNWLVIEAGGGRSATSLYRLWQEPQTAGETPSGAIDTAGELPAGGSPQTAGELPPSEQETAGVLPLIGGCFTPETAGDLPARTHQEQTKNSFTPSCAAQRLEAHGDDGLPAESEIDSKVTALKKAFEGFWQAYPKRRGKAEALKAWQRLAPGPELVEQIHSALAQARASPDWRKDGGQFIPYPATWLRRAGWEDELEADVEPLPPSQQASRYSESQRINGTLTALNSIFGGQQHAEHSFSEGHGVPVRRVWH